MYASPETITRSSATLGPNRGPYGWQDSDLLGGYERFPILFPLSQALHGTLSALRLIGKVTRPPLAYPDGNDGDSQR